MLDARQTSADLHDNGSPRIHLHDPGHTLFHGHLTFVTIGR